MRLFPCWVFYDHAAHFLLARSHRHPLRSRLLITTMQALPCQKRSCWRSLSVLLVDAGLGVNDQHGDITASDRIFRAFNAEEFNGIPHAAGLSHSGGVD